MCREDSPLALLAQQQLLKQQLLPRQGLVLEQLRRPQALQSSIGLVPVRRLLRLSRGLVQPTNQAAAPPARGAVAHSDAAVVQRLAAEPATAGLHIELNRRPYKGINKVSLIS